MRLESNKNTLWTSIFVDELARSGLEFACIAAGSRSTALTLALTQNDAIRCYSHVDERSAGFFALGIAMSTKKPVVLVSTSGTATANFYPAILEAFYSNVPLLILTADRPHELRSFGANQTMDQIKMYGDHVKWFIDVAPPQDDPSPSKIRYLRTLASRSYAITTLIPAGPVHINFPFTKPFEPTDAEASFNQKSLMAREGTRPFVEFHQGVSHPTDNQLNTIIDLIRRYKNGLIICGPRSPGGSFPEIISKLSQLLGYPILADPSSNLRFGKHLIHQPIMITSYETFLQPKQFDHLPSPQIILQFGSLPTSKNLQLYLEKLTNCHRIMISDTNQWIDPDKTTTSSFLVNPKIICKLLLDKISNISISMEWKKSWEEIEDQTWEILNSTLENEYFEGSIVSSVLKHLPDRTNVFVSNSLPIRHLDQFVKPDTKSLKIFVNRGLSGIDGTLSTALGLAIGLNEKIVLITGDLALYHDLNGFLSLQKYDIKIIIILLNNKGGGIFDRLPITKFDPPFKEFFKTPQNIDFASLTTMYGSNLLEHTSIRDSKELLSKLTSSLGDKKSHILEFLTDSKKTNDVINDVINKLN
jgi:2-succinyl-5-enolpyruvyl-6-hydroxy-3-cyclohexene-1-carboxylate synthase